MRLQSFENIENDNFELLMFISPNFEHNNYNVCDKSLSFAAFNDNGIYIGFVLMKPEQFANDIITNNDINISNEDFGCRILQITATTSVNEFELCKRAIHRISIWNTNNIMFDYYWSDTLRNINYFNDLFNSEIIRYISQNQTIEMLYGNIIR